jgi:hypothetical protein
MKYRFAFFFVLAVAVMLAMAGRGQESSSPLYPLKVGSKWHYRAAEGRKVTVTVARAEQLEILRTDPKEKKVTTQKVPGFALEIASGGRKPLLEHVAVLPDGVYRFGFAGKQISPPLCILKLPPQKGQTWQVDSTIGDLKVKGTFRTGEADIVVPAGKFTCVTVFLQNEEGNTDKTVLEYYFAPKVGIVKLHAHAGNIESTIELEK